MDADVMFKLEEARKEILSCRFMDSARAYELAEQMTIYARKTGDSFALAEGYYFMGDSCFIRGKMKKAIAILNEGLSVQKQYQYEKLMMRSYNVLAIIFYTYKEELLSLDYYMESLRLAKKLKDEVYEGSIYNNLGVLYLDFKDADQAIVYFNLGYEMCKKGMEALGMECSETKRFLNLMDSYIQKRDAVNAMKYYKLSREHITKEEYEIYAIVQETSHAKLMLLCGEREQAKKICDKIRSKDMERFRKMDFFVSFVDIAEIYLELEELDSMREVLDLLEPIALQDSENTRYLVMSELRIQYYRAKKDEIHLYEAYEKYYEYKQAEAEEAGRTTIHAIDNRFELEKEKKQQKLLERDTKLLEQQTRKDVLSGLYNRYGLQAYYEQYFEQAKELGKNFGVMVLDIDSFKEYNDCYGHLMGDSCIKMVAEVIKKEAAGCYPARYGGDEFFVISYDQTKETSIHFAKRIVEQVREQQMAYIGNGTKDIVTVSIGLVNEVPGDTMTVSDFIHGADAALYKVKRAQKDNFYFLSLSEEQ